MRTLNDFINGLKYRYPICCVLAYCLGANALDNGVVIRGELEDSFVPCRLHKKQAISHFEYVKRLNNGDVSWYIQSSR